MPIISPWIFYLISLVSNMHWMAFGIFMLSCLGTVISAIGFADVCSASDEEAIRKWFKRFAIVTIISLLVIIVLPNRELCYQMLAAKMVTYENVELAVEKIEEIAMFFMNGAK